MCASVLVLTLLACVGHARRLQTANQLMQNASEVVLGSQDSETRDCGDILIQNIVKMNGSKLVQELLNASKPMTGFHPSGFTASLNEALREARNKGVVTMQHHPAPPNPNRRRRSIDDAQFYSGFRHGWSRPYEQLLEYEDAEIVEKYGNTAGYVKHLTQEELKVYPNVTQADKNAFPPMKQFGPAAKFLVEFCYVDRLKAARLEQKIIDEGCIGNFSRANAERSIGYLREKLKLTEWELHRILTYAPICIVYDFELDFLPTLLNIWRRHAQREDLFKEYLLQEPYQMKVLRPLPGEHGYQETRYWLGTHREFDHVQHDLVHFFDR